MIFDIVAAALLGLLGVVFSVLAVGAPGIARRLRRGKAAAAAEQRSGSVVWMAIVGLLFWVLAAAAIAIPRWIDGRAGL